MEPAAEAAQEREGKVAAVVGWVARVEAVQEVAEREAGVLGARVVAVVVAAAAVRVEAGEWSMACRVGTVDEATLEKARRAMAGMEVAVRGVAAKEVVVRAAVGEAMVAVTGQGEEMCTGWGSAQGKTWEAAATPTGQHMV